MAERLNLGLIGAGRMGRLHAENIARRTPRAQLYAVADVIPEVASACAAMAGCNCTADWRELIADPQLDAVVICTATETHSAIIQAAAKAGKHIFCEKPIALNLADTDAALAAVNAAGVKLQIGFNRRFDTTFQRVYEARSSGEIGEPQLLHIISRDPAPPPLDYVRTSGGIFLDMTIHDFDMARHLIGADVKEVYARGDVLFHSGIGELGDFDTAVVMLTFVNGALGTIENSRKAVYGYDQRVELLGSRGAVSTENHYPNQVTISHARFVQRDLPLNFFLERYVSSYLDEMNAFVSAVLNDTPVRVSGEDARAALALGLAANKSIKEARPVQVSEIEASKRETHS
jgi:myo-inositol 2-dehydrogenase/D-chiro-inositol 1-dehydrogenase